jgi:TonB family protein
VNALHIAALVVTAGCTGTSVSSQSLVVTRAEVPIYPGVARGLGLTSTVRVAVTVKEGRVAGARVLTSAGSKALELSTLANIRTWEFDSGLDTVFVTTFTYEMTDSLTERPENPRVELRLPFEVRLIGSRSKPTVLVDPAPLEVTPKPPSR